MNTFFEKIVYVLTFAMLATASVVSAQTRETVQAAAKVAQIEAKAAIEVAKLEAATKVAEAKAKLDAAKAAAKAAEKAPKPTASDEIGIASDNQAVTTVTYRDATGVALEGSKDWARHEEKMAKIKADASRPVNPCGSWIMAPSYCYGYAVGGSYITPYSSYGSPYVASTVRVQRQTQPRQRQQQTPRQQQQSQPSGGGQYSGSRTYGQ